jgi:hypothetical protein
MARLDKQTYHFAKAWSLQMVSALWPVNEVEQQQPFFAGGGGPWLDLNNHHKPQLGKGAAGKAMG